MKRRPIYTETEHLCRTCGMGRIMQMMNAGPTGGGNPVFLCLTCYTGGAAMGPTRFCYCGWDRFGNGGGDFRCFNAEEKVPEGWRVFKQQYKLMVIQPVRKHD